MILNAISRMEPTVWPEPIWIKVKSSWKTLPQHQSTNQNNPESASIEIPFFQVKIYLDSKSTSKSEHCEDLLFEKFMRVIDTDSGPLKYELWCWGVIFQEFFTFIKIGSGGGTSNLAILWTRLKGIFGILGFFQKTNQQIRFWYWWGKTEVFCFLEESKDTKSHFKIIWPSD